ncbi:MAG TPA: zinc ribbon domain-containing protein [Chloroflexia bacterium]|nr:zinc ribbon domain-containing protein [Chloroflexia bacterium]
MVLVLDGIMAVLLVLFAVAGVRRGLWPEVVTLAGWLLGALLADEWGDAWGSDLAGALGVLGLPTARIIVRTLLFLVPLLVIGYGGALLLPRGSRLDARGRTIGGLLGLLNGVAIFATLLRNWHYSQGSSPLTTDLVTRFLLDWAGWWPLLLALGGMIAVAVAVMRRPRPVRKPVSVTVPPASASVPPAAYPPPVTGSSAPSSPFSGLRTTPPSSSSSSTISTVPSTPVTPPGDNGSAKEAKPTIVAPAATSGPDEHRCRTCGKILAPGAAFCPNCGTPV